MFIINDTIRCRLSFNKIPMISKNISYKFNALFAFYHLLISHDSCFISQRVFFAFLFATEQHQQCTCFDTCFHTTQIRNIKLLKTYLIYDTD